MYILFNKLEKGIVKIEELAIFAIFMTLVFTLFSQVIFRFVIKMPLAFPEELSRVLLVWLVFIGSARGVYVSQHFMVGLAFDALPKSFQKIVNFLISMVTIGFLSSLMWISWHSAQSGSIQQLPVLGTSIIFQTLAMPIGTGLMAFHSIMHLVRCWADCNQGIKLVSSGSNKS